MLPAAVAVAVVVAVVVRTTPAQHLDFAPGMADGAGMAGAAVVAQPTADPAGSAAAVARGLVLLSCGVEMEGLEEVAGLQGRALLAPFALFALAKAGASPVVLMPIMVEAAAH
jgi:hypothetical protein